MNTKITFLLALLCCVYFDTKAQIDYSISGNTNIGLQEGEAHIAINPTDSLKMVMGFMGLSMGGLEFNVYHTSDGGDSWQLSTLNTSSYIGIDFPSYTAIGGGDIVFAYDKNGDLYCSWINLIVDLTSPTALDSALWTAYWAKSTDNGNTFTLADDHFFGLGKISVSAGTPVVHDYMDGISDRQWMAVDLSNSIYQNNLYVGYINYPFDPAQTGLKVKTMERDSTSFSAATTAYAGSGQLTNIGVDTNGVLHYSFCDIALNRVFHVSSADGGQTFTNPHLIRNGVNLFPVGAVSAVNDRENAAPSLAIDGDNNLHLVWNEFPSNQPPNAYYSSSTNGGVNWTTPVELDDFFDSKTFMPVVSAKGKHVTIGCNVLDASLKSEYFLVSSSDNGMSFSKPVKVSSGITDFDAIGTTPFVGDYSSSVRTNCNIYSLWTDCRDNGCKQYIAKYDECSATGIAQLTPINSTFYLKEMYPVPVENELTIITESSIEDRIVLELFDGLGKKVAEEKHLLTNGENKMNVEVSNLHAGHYVLRLINDKGIFITRSFVKN